MSMPKGWKSAPQNKLDAKRAETLHKLVAAGVPRPAIAERLGVSVGTVRNYIVGASKPAN